MLNSIHRAFIQTNAPSIIRVINATHNKLCSFQFHHFSSTSAQKPISQSVNQDSFTVNYLINAFGFLPERAISASKYLKVGSKEKPDLVLSFLKSQGFTKEQILHLVRHFPPIILCCPERTLLPKIEFFLSRGVSDADVTKIFVRAPWIFKRSLKKQIAPSFDYVKRLFDTSGTSLSSGYRWVDILNVDLESVLLPNIEVLKDAGVPDSNILALLQCKPRSLIVPLEQLRKVVEEVKEMRFDPREMKFISAIRTFMSMSKPTWEKKVVAYKKWGWSETDVILAFERYPKFMMTSTDKIMLMMDFLVNKMGFDSSLVLKMPELFTYSLEKRIKPRFLVYANLVEKGLIKKGSFLPSTFTFTESKFLMAFVQRYEKEVPELLQLYQEAFAVSKG